RTERFLTISMAVLFACSLLSLLTALRLHRFITEPVLQLAAAADKVRSEGDYSVRVRMEGSDELAMLGATFNQMLGGIEARDEELTGHRERLEKLVAQRTQALDARNRAMGLVLDNVDQGLATVDGDGVLSSERSASFDGWFGAPAAGETLPDFIQRLDPAFGDWFAICWEDLQMGIMPEELLLAQMPTRWTFGDRHYTLSYKPIGEDAPLSQLLVMVGDVTERVQQMEKEAEQLELISIFQAVGKDPVGFEDFRSGGETLLAEIIRPEAFEDPVLLKRQIHTLKGNAGLYGLGSVSRACHALEDVLDSGDCAEALEALTAAWALFEARVAEVRGTGGDGAQSGVSPEELQALAEAAAHAPREALVAEAERLSFAPAEGDLRSLADKAKGMASRQGMELDAVWEGGELRLPRRDFAPLFSEMAHVVRNAVDHGIEPPDVREAAGKPRRGTVVLSAAQEGDHILLSIEDDGKGMDADVLRRKAVEKGMMDEDAAARLEDKDCYNLIFAAGFSTKTEISDVSGRGVGMDVVKTRIAQMNGTVEIDSAYGKGSKITIKLPLTLAILPTLMVILGQQPFALPLASVVEIFNLDLSRTNTVDGQLTIRVRDRALPLFYLRSWLVRGAQAIVDGDGQHQGHVVVVNVGGVQVGLVVDFLVGQEEVVIKPLGALLQGLDGMAGATITGDGKIALILDVPGLMRKYARRY
ncbi:MAG: chemotaxis protein CheW, partial [Gammaproteobacteria bacterium]|nr:chemotaxis protein CheW [Gammaproteobacteria bacterium]